MIRIEDKDLLKLIPLCHSDDIITLGILNNHCGGWALVDNADQPKRALVLHGHLGFLNYIGEAPSDDMATEIAKAAIEYRSDRSFVYWAELANYPENVIGPIKSAFPEVNIKERIVWCHDYELFQKAPLPSPAEGIKILPMTEEDFNRETPKFETLLFWDRTEDMLNHAIGVKAVSEKDGLIGLCVTAAMANSHFEIDITTTDTYRRAGVGYAMAHAFTQLCYDRDMKPGWDCVSDNAPSIGLATKLGFREVRRYKLLSWAHK